MKKHFSQRCDALTQCGRRCRRTNHAYLPCVAIRDPRCTSYAADEYRPVRLCCQHAAKGERLRRAGRRLRLHHGGWFGPYNEYKYGNLVIDQEAVDWETVREVRVPRFWAMKEAPALTVKP